MRFFGAKPSFGVEVVLTKLYKMSSNLYVVAWQEQTNSFWMSYLSGFLIIWDFQSISSILLFAILDFVLFAKVQYHANLRVLPILPKFANLMVPCMNNSEICEMVCCRPQA